MILDSISFNEHDYHLVSNTTATYEIKLKIVKVLRGRKFERFRVDSPFVEILKVAYAPAGKKRANETTSIIEQMKEDLTNIVLEEAVKTQDKAMSFIKGDSDGDDKWFIGVSKNKCVCDGVVFFMCLYRKNTKRHY